MIRADLISTTAPGEPADVLSGMIMVLGVIMLVTVLMLSVRRRIARRQASTRPPRERLDHLKAEARRRDDTNALQSRLLDTAQRLAAQLDTKAARLEQLIDLADDRLAALAAATEPPGSGGAPIPTIRPEMAEAIPAAAGVSPDPISAAVYRLADDGRDVVDIARELDEQIGKVELILALRGEAAG